MKVSSRVDSITYFSDAGDWGLKLTNGEIEILPQAGGLIYQSATNVENLANLIFEAKAHATQNGITWQR